MRRLGGLVLALHFLGLPGCSFYRSDTFCQWPSGDPMRQNVEHVLETGFPKIKVDRREGVLSRLGVPDQSSADQKEFVYRWRKVLCPGGCLGDIKRTFLFRVWFDDQGIVRDLKFP